jgi:hypothetical protein
MELFQLVANGKLAMWPGSGRIHSRSVFTLREDAERFIPEFRRIVTQSDGGADLATLEDNAALKIKIITLELMDSRGVNDDR